MAISTLHLSLLLTLSSLAAAAASASADGSDVVAELLALQSQSDSGVIHLNDHLFNRLLTATKPPRPFSLLIFFDATQLHSKTELQLKALRSEFALVASSFIANNEDNPSSRSKLFFCDVEFRESQSTFSAFGVNSLPHIRLVPATARNVKDDSQQMDAGDFSRLAESMAEFVESKTKLTVGPIHRPPLFSKKQLMVIFAVVLIWLPFMVKKVIAGETLLHDRKIWMAGAVFVYFFSVSGSMHNIIRKMPMFLADRNDPSRLIFFYQGSGMQLGAEGFAIGFLYTIVGLLLALMTHVLVKVRNVTAQRLIMIVALFVSFWAVKKVVSLDNWKTGYGIHMYWPSSWQ
ncbi:probable dolichyl-diphosphooligosaccharide--protein glycosyltransferase subunit 3B [Diospyros lotus]|uniref:probable dolichyl-diphosphooligosaccharide--protein glycosyltransferase subunit 3B n=1 Tax=Diospyros lotus TaxID=55363 RepID=UPI002257B5E4|nr:probable dolichyl-diphosphooligosaccharide--protein glycosyltransferase subunit 3B [Diospyros lotus]XP_052181617.1 probable dolichyl-diphosphooligosaccharide--protein glycosyltransferase subunit 3B [Diospyros lotus]XP_052181618.1 probable dolichyl-diphosphooligosaccharide--protein glycosyltransferase subunit 3B [Diospyros lotus]XP_052181619.1 probable dolichyl-diphosphooligosaccharide--protein glycosyltransferase subunit 3B [Diospyros lotus]